MKWANECERAWERCIDAVMSNYSLCARCSMFIVHNSTGANRDTYRSGKGNWYEKLFTQLSDVIVSAIITYAHTQAHSFSLLISFRQSVMDMLYFISQTISKTKYTMRMVTTKRTHSQHIDIPASAHSVIHIPLESDRGALHFASNVKTCYCVKLAQFGVFVAFCITLLFVLCR